MDDLGQNCSLGNNGRKATVISLGILGNVGIGPYSVSFDHLGKCYIISGKDHHRAEVDISQPTLPIIGTVAVDASWNNPPIPPLFPIASCISGTTQIIGHSLTATSSTPTFFHFGIPIWKNKGTLSPPIQIIDYTSTAKSLSIFK